MPPPPPRFFSTFGYEQGAPAPGMMAMSPSLPAATPPPPSSAQLLNTLTRRSQMQHLQHAPSPHESLELEERHSGGPPRSHYGGLIVASTIKPHEICHHHHQHQQHQQQQQQLQQRGHHPHPAHQHLQQLQQHQQQAPSVATRLPHKGGQTMLPGGKGPGGGGGGVSAGVGGAGGKPLKNEESKVFIDIRNSAPDVIIMTSH